MIDRPHFCVSDLHMGDGGPRDNFAHMSGGWREQEFLSFLDYVEDQGGELTIIGDLFELWQGNISKVLTCRLSLMDRLADMGAIYLLGNHDIDLRHFNWSNRLRLSHPLFADLKLSHEIVIGGKFIRLIHGHEQDPYCCDEKPGIGRISAIYTGIKEDRNGGPLRGKYGTSTVEARTLGRISRFSGIMRRLTGKPSATQVMRRNIVEAYKRSGCDALVFGHTHEPGQFWNHGRYTLPIYNCGSWAEKTCSFAKITPDGYIEVMDWIDGKPRPNFTNINVD